MTRFLEHGYAVIIGVDDNSIPQLTLPTLARDVQAVYDVFTHPQRCAYGPENVILLHGTEATKDNIFEAFLWLQDGLKEKDAWDIYYIVQNHPGGVSGLVEEILPLREMA